jgi:hypothetical protein
MGGLNGCGSTGAPIRDSHDLIGPDLGLSDVFRDLYPNA